MVRFFYFFLYNFFTDVTDIDNEQKCISASQATIKYAFLRDKKVIIIINIFRHPKHVS